MTKRVFVSCLGLLFIAAATVVAAEVDLKDIKCVVAKQDAQASKSAEYRDAKVYFCCDKCAGKFAEDSSKFATKANQQLVATKQYEQKVCPFTGADLNMETAIKVGDAKVAFCCEKCQAKAEATEGDKQLELVFADKSFEKAFKKVEPKDET